MIVFCADHGELLGDHYTYRKVLPYQGSVNVPMIVFNGGISGKQDNLVELRDVMATFLDAAGAEIPESIDGISILSDNGREFLHGEHSGGFKSNHYIVTKTDKFCWFSQSGREQYFHLESDPHELHDRIGDPDCQERIGVLRKELIRVLTGREEGYTDGERLIAGQTPRSVLSFLEK